MSDLYGATPPSVETLRKSLADLIEESQALRGDVHSAEQARRAASRINLLAVGVVALLVGLLCVVTVQNNRLARQVSETNRTMADCTTPGGKCYNEGRSRTDGAVGAVVRISVYVSQCGRLWPGESGPAYDRKLEQCVAERLAAATARTPQPTPTPTPSR